MILLIDVGNTRAKYCTVSKGIRGSIQSIQNELLTNEYFTKYFSNIERVIVASVSHHKLTNIIESWSIEYQIDYQRVVSEKSKNGITSGYERPNQLGVDRWLTLIAAKTLYPSKNTLIVDAGTATTVDLLSADGTHKGGWILAGIDTLFKCVLENTSQVKASNENVASLSFGLNSSDNVNNATWAATVGSISIAMMESEKLGIFIDEIVLTGGNGAVLASLLPQRCTMIEDLVFIGLQAYI